MNIIKNPKGEYQWTLPPAVLEVVQMALDTQIKDCRMFIRKMGNSKSPAVIEALEQMALDTINVQNFLDSCK